MKIDILNYLIEANILLTISALMYYAFLNNEHVFRTKRFYILSSVLLALITPLIHVSTQQNSLEVINQSWPTIYLDNVVIGSDQVVQKPVLDFIEIILLGYAIVAVMFFGAFLYQLFSLWSIKKLGSNHVTKQGKHTIIYMKESYPSFSFFNTIFINLNETKGDEDRSKIIEHELVHAKQWHSLDIMLLFISRAIFWINPVVWFYRNSQQETHEYLVDQQILKTTNKSIYQSLLAQVTLNHHYSAGNFFAKNQTIKRINMMNDKLKKHSRWRSFAAMISLAVTVSFIACNDETIALIDSAEMVANIPASSQIALDKIRADYPDEQFSYIEIDLPPKGSFNITDFVDNPNTIQHIEVDKSRNKAGLILSNNEEFKRLVEYTKSDDDVFDIVEQQPEPLGGMEKFYRYIGQNLTYPSEARKNGIEGRVFVQFVIDEQGKLTEPLVLKGIGSGCDAEALRVINEAENWTPGYVEGKVVKTRMILPITFNIGGKIKKENAEVTIQKTEQVDKLEEVVVVGYEPNKE